MSETDKPDSVAHNLDECRNEHEKLLQRLQERMKESQCLYAVSQSVCRREPLAIIFQEVISLIPSAYRYPQITRAKLEVNGEQYVSEPFEPTEWKQAGDIIVDSKRCGSLEVYYLQPCEESHESDEGPFSHEERNLIDTLARMLGETIERRWAQQALRNSEQRFRTLVESTSDWIWEVSADGIYTYASPMVKHILGYEPQEIIGKKPFDLMPPDEAKRAGEVFAQIVRDKAPIVRLKNTNLHKDGRRIVLQASGTPILDAKGDLLGYRGIDRDITEEVLAQKELADTNRWLQAIMDHSPDGIDVCIHNDKTKKRTLFMCNDRYVEMSGRSREELMACEDINSFFEKQIELPYKEQVSGKILYRGVSSWIRPDGRENYYQWVAVPFNIEGQIYFLGIDRDITDQKRANEELSLSHQLLQIASRHNELKPLLDEIVVEIVNFTNCQAVGIRILGAEGQIPYESHVGFPKEFYEKESPLSIKSDQCMCINVIRGDFDPSLEFYTEGGSFYMNATTRFLAIVSEADKGSTRNVCNQFGYESVALVPIREGGKILGLIHIADTREEMVPLHMVQVIENTAVQLGTVIKRIWAEQELRKTHDELETRVDQRTEQLLGAYRQLQEEIAERRHLEGEVIRTSEAERERIGHDLHDDLGQMLSGAAFMAQALHRKLTGKDLKEATDAGEIAKHLSDSVTLAKSLAKGLCPVDPTPEGLMKTMEVLAERVHEMFGVSCVFKCDKPVLVSDHLVAGHLYRIAQEAATNAIRHGRADRILIDLYSRNGSTILSVLDNGVGLPEEKDILTGMGMRIMKYRARAIGAKLDVQRRKEGGTAVICAISENESE